MVDVATAVVAAKGDVTKWVKLDPSNDPLKPTIKVTSKGKDLVLSVREPDRRGKKHPRGIVDYVKSLADLDQFKKAGDSRTVYDAYKIADILNRAANSQVIAKSFQDAGKRKGRADGSSDCPEASNGRGRIGGPDQGADFSVHE